MPRNERPGARTIVAISQVYPPDPTSLGQHLGDVAVELVQRGHRVVVYTADRAYENPAIRYPRRERLNGVEVVRLPFSSFGKGSMLARLAGGVAFLLQAVVRALFTSRLGTVIVSTSPPMAGLAGALVAGPRRARLVYWVMDLNPDQAVALGVVGPRSPFVALYDWMNRVVLRRADAVVAMDRFMARRLEAKHPIGKRLHVMPPWPHEDQIVPPPQSANPFRSAHGLDGKFVVMYSGNHSLANPLHTVIAAALALKDDRGIMFVFVGGGAGKREVEAAGAPNILSLPYQPLATLGESLSAADVHLVTMGNEMVGIIHPCKAYGAFSVERPIIFVGPPASHITDILDSAAVGWHVAHGDVPGMISLVRSLAAMPPADLSAFGMRARELIRDRLSKDTLCGGFCDIVEASGLVRPTPLPG